MAFSGYLISVGGNTEEFEKYIVDQSYHVSKKPLDMGSYRDGNGELKRTVLEHVPYNISFNIRNMNNTNLQTFLNMIRSSFTIARERKLSLTFYNPEDDNYITQDVYMPDPDFTIHHIDLATNEVWFKETTIKFIGY